MLAHPEAIAIEQNNNNHAKNKINNIIKDPTNRFLRVIQ